MGKLIAISTARIPRRASLTGSVAAAVALACLALLALDLWHTWQARASALAEDKAATANLAASLARHAHDTVQSVDSILLDLRERVETDGEAPDALARLHRVMAAAVGEMPQVHGLFVYDTQGDWLATSLDTMPRGMNNGDRSYFAYHSTHADRQPYVGKPVHSKSDGSWIITVSRRIDGPHGAFSGIVLATVSIASLDAFYGTFDVGPQGVISLLTTDGTLVARKSAGRALTGTDFSGSQIFREFLPRSPAGSYQYTSMREHVVRLGSYESVDGYPLVVLVAHGLEDVLAGWWQDAIIHLAITLALAVALAVMGARFARQIARQHFAERQYRLLADYGGDAIICTDLAGAWVYVSPAFTTLSGWSTAEARTHAWEFFVHPEDQEAVRQTCRQLRPGGRSLSVSYRAVCKSGGHLWVEALYHMIPASDGQPAQYIATIRDISARKAAEESLAEAHRQLAVQASTDGLTGLLNRRRFDEALAQEWQRASRDEQPVSLLLIDIDRFKLYNDRYGHQEGDACLRVVCGAIAASARRPADVAARYGGEEMVLLLPNTEERGAARVAEAVRAAIEATRVEHEGNPPLRLVTASIGVAAALPQADHRDGGPEALIAAADAALYEAKRAGRNRVILAQAGPAMPNPPVLAEEDRRLEVLSWYEAAGVANRSESLDRITRLTAALFRAPVALVSLIGPDRQCFPGRAGLEVEEIPRSISFCAHAIAGEGVFTVADATRDPRFQENPLVTGPPHVRFYAGAPLLAPHGQKLGSLCILDFVARPPLSGPEKLLLTDLAALAVSYMDQVRLQADAGS